MGDLTLPQRLRVAAAIMQDGEVTFRLTRGDLLALVRMLESQAKVDELAERMMGQLATLDEIKRQRDRAINGQIYDATVFTALTVGWGMFLTWWSA